MGSRFVLRRAVAAAVFLFAAGAVAFGADGPADAIAALGRGDFAAAATSLERLEAADAATFRANNYDYLLGRVLEQKGDYAGASARYTAVAGRASNLAEYALWRLAGIARDEGNFRLERDYLTRLGARFPSSLLYTESLDRIARSAFESGDYATVVARLGARAGVRGTTAREALARVSTARLRLGDATNARNGFATLLAGSQDDYALAGARGLDEIDESQKAKVSEFDHVVRGRVYLFNRDWLGARKHFQAVADGDPASPNRAEALYAVGTSYFRVNDYKSAVDWWEKTAREFPTSPTGIKAYYWVGHAYQRAGDQDKAVARYADFIAKYPTDEQVEGAYRNAIDSLRLAGKTADALAWCNRAEAAQPRSALATFAAFNRAKTLLAAGDASGALAEFTRLKTSYNVRTLGAGMPFPAEIDLLRGACLERLGRASEAVSIYLATVPKRDDYFANRATERLLALSRRPDTKPAIDGLLAGAVQAARDARSRGDAVAAKASADRALRLTDDPATRADMLGVLRASYASLPAYSRVSLQAAVPVGRSPIGAGGAAITDRSHASLGAELAFLGLYDEAAGELEASGLGARSSYSMAIYNNRGSRAYAAVQLGESLAKDLPADYRVELLPRDFAELIYPAPYRDSLRKFALPSGLDPRFELSIARQESRFKPWVKSPAAARGLVQFIPDTSEKIAAALGVQNFDQDDLYDPHVAVRFGAKYMSDLFALFPNNPYAVAASYNGGEDAVARWLQRAPSKDDPDLFVAEVGYKESKDYVFKVMNNYWAYQALYTPELNVK